MIIDCISDLHGFYPQLDGGDLLIVAGDLMSKDTKKDYIKFMRWIDLISFKYKKVVVIAGNHDNLVQEYGKAILPTFCEYLCDSGTEFEGLKIWGSPWTTKFEGINPKYCAFTVDTDEELAEKWKLIPDDIDILITHIPPFLVLDSHINPKDGKYHCAGSESLANKINLMKNLKLHVFGHIHECGGRTDQYIRKSLYLDNVKMVNASHVNERYEPVNKPIRVIL